DLRSRRPDDLSLVPKSGWAQFLIGDGTGSTGTGAYWDGPAADPAGLLDEAACRLRADGWDVHRAEPGVVEAHKGTLRLELLTTGERALLVDRVPPEWHVWAVLAGALLGAAAAYAVAVRRRRRAVGAMVWTGLACVLPSFATAVLVVASELSRHPWLDTPLWRDARHYPLGAALNLAVVLLAVGLWRAARDDTGPRYRRDGWT
ncbi:MAG TPA: hypothetical protein VGF17_04145, partial [Phytomonospora sp.]